MKKKKYKKWIDIEFMHIAQRLMKYCENKYNIW